MWLCNSSIGRKVVMSVTGIALILFLTFHGCMNVVALFSAKGYNMICEFLGANWIPRCQLVCCGSYNRFGSAGSDSHRVCFLADNPKP